MRIIAPAIELVFGSNAYMSVPRGELAIDVTELVRHHCGQNHIGITSYSDLMKSVIAPTLGLASCRRSLDTTETVSLCDINRVSNIRH